MKLLVSEELLRQTFGLESPITDIRLSNMPPALGGGEPQRVFEFTVGNDNDQRLLEGRGYSYQSEDGQRWYRMEYEIGEA